MEKYMANDCPTATNAQVFLQLMQTLFAVQCTLSNPNNFPPDRTEEVVNSNRGFDFVIVGAGSAGCVLANRLTEIDKWKVLLIEAGNDPSVISDIPALFLQELNSPEDYAYVVEPEEHACHGTKTKLCKWGKGKLLGGSSAINAMLYVMGNDRDYDSWSQMGNKGWSYEEVLPYFRKSQNCVDGHSKEWRSKYCASGGPLNIRYFNYTHSHVYDMFEDAARELKIPILDTINGDKYIGYGNGQVTADKGRRMSTAKAFLSPIKDRSNLYVMKSARADAVLMNGIQAVGVRVTLKDGRSIDVRASKEVILSAGSIASPQLLMLSGIGPKQHLAEMGIPAIVDLPVGKNLLDHISWIGLYISYKNESTTPLSPTDTLDNAYEYLMYNRGAFASHSFYFLSFLNVNDLNSKYPDIQFHHAHVPQWKSHVTQMLLSSFNIDEEISRGIIEMSTEADLIGFVPVLLNPKSVGKLRLRSKDPAVPVQIYANYFSEQKDLETMLKVVKFIKKMLKTETFKRLGMQLRHIDIPGCRHTEVDSDEYWKCNLRHMTSTLYHAVGTAKMGPSNNPTAVVDDRLRVHGVKSLRVIDASIMPTITSGNTNAPTIMIAEKGADLIKEDWKFTKYHEEL